MRFNSVSLGNGSSSVSGRHAGSVVELLRTVKYFLFASSAGLIEMGVFSLLAVFTPLPYWPCYLTALILSVLWNFTLNRRFTFRSAGRIAPAMLKVAAYYAVFTPVSTLLGSYLAETVGVNEYLVTLGNLLVNGVTEFLYQRFFVFGKTIDSIR
ncbi:MAG: GtrA family protein [Chordicoccus sp.]